MVQQLSKSSQRDVIKLNLHPREKACDQGINLSPGSSADESSSGFRQTVLLAMLFSKISKDLGMVRGLEIFKMLQNVN